MPKKTAYSRSGAQRSKTKQKSFELVRPVSDEKELETAESSEEANVVDVVGSADAEMAAPEAQEVEEEAKGEVKEKVGKRASAKVNAPASVTVAATPATSANGAPKSASARLAARRQAAQKTQRSTANLIMAENYGYVRKDLVFILILAIIMFAVIIALHFVLGS